MHTRAALPRSLHLVLGATILAGALAGACGAPPASAPAASPPSASAAPSPSAAAVDAGATPVTPPPLGEATKPAETGGASVATSVEIGPSSMLADLKAIGVDPLKYGDLSKMEMSKKRK